MASKFSTGDRVLFVPGPSDSNVRRGVYTVIHAMPDAGRGCQYRVKHPHDGHERIIDEVRLRAAALS